MSSSGTSTETPPLSSSADSGAASVSKELLVTLTNLRTIRLDDSIFSDPSFISLADYGVTIPPQPVGRRNPFAPLPMFSPGGASPGSVIPLPRGN